MRQTLRRSAQRNHRAIEGLACVLGLLIGVALGVIVSSNAPAHRVLDGGHASAAMLP